MADKNVMGKLTVRDDKIDKIGVYFRKSTLKDILRMLTMEHNGFRSFKSVKNINRLFSNIDMSKYNNRPELQSYIWCIKFFSYQWLQGLTKPEYIRNMAENSPEYDQIKGDIINASLEDTNIIEAAEGKVLLEMVNDNLQYGYIATYKDDYINLLDEIRLDQPGAYKELANRLFTISSQLLDIRHTTSLIDNKITFTSDDVDSIRAAIVQTLDSLSGNNNIFKTGLYRLNTLLSPGYMNGRLYIYMALPGGYKSMMLLKTALDFRKYNPGFKGKTPGMKQCVLYITMENSFTETIERLWNLTFDEPITRYDIHQATKMICEELGIKMATEIKSEKKEHGLLDEIQSRDEENNSSEPTIEIIIKYFPYRSISTDDLYTIIQDLRDENYEVCGLILDYIKRIKPSVPTADNVKLELNHIGNELKTLAVIQDIPVITAHQLNRAAASTVDTAVRQGKVDVTRLTGRENTGDAWELMEVADLVIILNIEVKPGTDDRYLCMQLVKRRRVDGEANEMSQFTYLAHPFNKKNPIRLIDDFNTGKVLSVLTLNNTLDEKNSKLLEKNKELQKLRVAEEFAADPNDAL